MRDKVTRQCPQTTTFEEKGEPKQIRTGVFLLASLTPYRWAKPAHTIGDGQLDFYTAPEQSQRKQQQKKQCPQTTFEEKGKSKRNRTEVPLLTSLTPNRWAKPVARTASDAVRIPPVVSYFCSWVLQLILQYGVDCLPSL